MANTDQFTTGILNEVYFGQPGNNNTFYREGIIGTRVTMPGTEQSAGPMIERYQRIFIIADPFGPNAARFTKPISNLLFFRLMVDGPIKEISVFVGQANARGNWYFNVRQNGVALFSGSNRLLIPSGTGGEAIKTNLSIPGSNRDEIRLDLEETGGGSLQGPIVFTVVQEG